MAPEDQRQQTLQLVALGEVDQRRTEVQKLIDSVPRVLAARQRDSTGAQSSLEGAQQKLQGFRVRLKSLELELQARESELQRANANLLTAKTNQEYSALMDEIARRRDEKSAAESAVLEQYDVIKQGEAAVALAKGRLGEAAEDYHAFEARARGELDEHHRELAELDRRREQVRKAIPVEILKIYDRAFRAHGNAIVPAEANVCQGCFSNITPNDRSRLISGRELIVCRSCQRILYLPEVVQASPP